MYAILSPLSSSMVAPCVPIMSADLGVTPPFKQNMMVSIYMAGYVVGPLVMGPLSEVFGRKRVLMVANAIFIIFNTLCSRASSFSEMAAFRIFAGVGGAGPLSVCGGGLADMWDPSERGKAIALFSLGVSMLTALILADNCGLHMCYTASSDRSICLAAAPWPGYRTDCRRLLESSTRCGGPASMAMGLLSHEYGGHFAGRHWWILSPRDFCACPSEAQSPASSTRDG